MLSLLRHSLLPARRGLLCARALPAASVLLSARALTTSALVFKTAAGTTAAAAKPKAVKEPKEAKPKKAAAAKAPAKRGRPANPKTKAKKDAEKPKAGAGRPKKVKLPAEQLPPKRPLSAYARFFQDWFSTNSAALKQDGKLDVASMSRAVGQAWADLQTSDPARVERLKAAAAADQTAYNKTYKDWYFARDATERTAIEKATGKKLLFPGGRAKFRRELRERPGNPGRPSSSFFEYFRSIKSELERRPEVVGKAGIEGHQVMAKMAAERWRTLPEQEKAGWRKKWQERKAEFDEWFKTQQESGPQK